jgi:hypothetical protein
VVRISHRDQLEDLIQKGRDLEKVVLSRAVRWHIRYCILLYAGKTVIFDYAYPVNSDSPQGVEAPICRSVNS